MSRLRITLFGGVSLAVPGPRVLPLAASCRPLLGYLLTQRRRAVPRLEVAELLWPGQDSDSARRCLSTALWRLKQCIGSGPPLLAACGCDDLALNDGARVWVDAWAFEQRLAPLLRRDPDTLAPAELARLERGLRLYCGPYLAGIDAEWALIERQRLRSLYCDALYQLTLACVARAQWARALAWGRLLAREEPLREDVQRTLMLALAHTGNRAGALAQYREHAQRLARELGVEPMAETRALYQRLAQAGDVATAPATAPAPALPPGAADSALGAARRRIGRVQRVLAASQLQLEAALQSLPPP
ncbi:hypothetical protein HLB44_01855 [Aquincola sp. S2]|uniref:Bacterial transcriptional activator domain-containing protein n=1 Tax=Pseudaquabacterium terrae TaxID=2732868 RepID=A0ABX2E9N4_9BURK|nr:BTAD domain-containing putative transcriptional regulator [Aquabacterium terrae]NRF65721.1 hypothetical protein [Aquabacterium terrae]